jgi:hypothetical protein
MQGGTIDASRLDQLPTDAHMKVMLTINVPSTKASVSNKTIVDLFNCAQSEIPPLDEIDISDNSKEEDSETETDSEDERADEPEHDTFTTSLVQGKTGMEHAEIDDGMTFLTRHQGTNSQF